MLAKELISDSIPPVKTSDAAAAVLAWMGEFKVNHLPIVNHEELLGIVSESDLLELEELDTPVGSVELLIPRTVLVHENSHLYEVLAQFAAWKIDIMPVVMDGNRYSGLVTRGDMISAVSTYLGAGEPGGIIVLEMPLNGYSLAEIGRICESNDAKVISLTTTSTYKDAALLMVTLKLNIRELSRVISTFERFDYKIAQVVFDAEQLDDVRTNYENLLKYLSM